MKWEYEGGKKLVSEAKAELTAAQPQNVEA